MIRALMRHIGWLLLLLAIVMAGATLAVTAGQHDRRLAAGQHQVDRLQHRNARTQARAASIRQHTVRAALGVDPTRVVKDSSTIETLLHTAFTWSSGAGYDAARHTLARKYGLDSGSQFVRAVLPAQPHQVDQTGKTYYYVDATGSTSALEHVQVIPARVVATDYHYVVAVTVNLGSHTPGRESHTRRYLVRLVCGGDGQLRDVTVAMTGQATRNSN